jgi:hypothetical protein
MLHLQNAYVHCFQLQNNPRNQSAAHFPMYECPALPIEIWLDIVSFLDGLSVRMISQVSKTFYEIGNDNKLWKLLCNRNGYTERKLIQDLR